MEPQRAAIGPSQSERADVHTDSRTDVYLGSFLHPDWVEGSYDNPSRRHNLFGEVNWIAKIAGGKLDARVNVNTSRASGDNGFLNYSAGRRESYLRRQESDTDGAQAGLNVKYSRSLGEGHALSTGVEINRQTSSEDRVDTDIRNGGPPERIVESFEPTVLRLATYAQDEWNLTKQWSVYLGARWEQLRTDSTGSSTFYGRSDVHAVNQVLSPVMQTLYKFPDKSGRQLRAALTRTYKAPTTDQLTARRTRSIENTIFSPDYGGNPNVEPELATGIDLTYEHFFKPGAVFSVTGAVRRIDGYIRWLLDQDADGRWIYHPINSGNADVRSLEMELKFPLKTLFPNAPALDLRFNLARNWSTVDSVPGPNNRLDAQTPLSGNVGIDYKSGPWSMGGNLAYRRGGPVQISRQESRYGPSQTDIDTYAAYRFNPKMQLRLGLRAVTRDFYARREFNDAAGRRINENWAPQANSAFLNLELKF